MLFYMILTFIIINIPLQKAHKGVVGLLIVLILTLVTAALCVIGIIMYGRRAKRLA